MEYKSFKCPECGANIENTNASFCSSCGVKLHFDDGSKNINYNYKTEDVAKIKEIELNREIELNKIKTNARFVDNKFILSILFTFAMVIIIFMAMLIYGSNATNLINKFWLGVLLFFIFYAVLFIYLYNKSKSQENNLQNIVDEIQNNINSGNYEMALVKTKSLRYTAKWSNDIKEKWDDIRESIIKIIEEKKWI